LSIFTEIIEEIIVIIIITTTRGRSPKQIVVDDDGHLQVHRIFILFIFLLRVESLVRSCAPIRVGECAMSGVVRTSPLVDAIVSAAGSLALHCLSACQSAVPDSIDSCLSACVRNSTASLAACAIGCDNCQSTIAADGVEFTFTCPAIIPRYSQWVEKKRQHEH
jgi:hypothetical protein